MAASSNSKQVFDVAKPGKSAPSPTSRPVIVNHGPIMKDPMVSEPEEKKKDDSKKTAPAETHKVIAPLGDVESPDKEEKEAAVSESEKPAEEGKEDKKKATEQAVVDAVVDQAAKKKKNQPTEEDLAKQAEVEKLIQSKKYFVPIGEVTRRRNTRRLMIGLFVFVVLAIVGGYLAIDTGLLDVNVSLPVDLIKN